MAILENLIGIVTVTAAILVTVVVLVAILTAKKKFK